MDSREGRSLPAARLAARDSSRFSFRKLVFAYAIGGAFRSAGPRAVTYGPHAQIIIQRSYPATAHDRSLTRRALGKLRPFPGRKCRSAPRLSGK